MTTNPQPPLPQGCKAKHPHKPEGCHGYYIQGKEDEMVTIHSAGKYVETLYASCPEQANDFVSKFKEQVWKSMDDVLDTFAGFKATWKTRYTEEDGW